MKKILITLFVFISFLSISSVSAKDKSAEEIYNMAQKEYNQSVEDYNEALYQYQAIEVNSHNYDISHWVDSPEYKQAMKELNDAKQNLEDAKNIKNFNNEQLRNSKDRYCEQSWNCLNTSDFKINTSTFKMWSLGVDSGKTSWQNANFLLATVISKLMIAMWVLAVLIMTIGAGYMVLYHGRDDMLSKWKTIFNYGMLAVALALCSYILVAILRFILYN